MVNTHHQTSSSKAKPGDRERVARTAPSVRRVDDIVTPARGINSILVATDGDTKADTACIVAAFLAGWTGADVHVVAVLDTGSPHGAELPRHGGTSTSPCRDSSGKCEEDLGELLRIAVESQL